MEQVNKRSEYRTCKIETRVDEKQEGGKKLVLRGYPILFNTETNIYDFWYGEVRETILPTALNGTDLTDVYLITGHNIEPDKVLGRNNVNMRMEVDDTGLFFECPYYKSLCFFSHPSPPIAFISSSVIFCKFSFGTVS